jgi:Ca2+/H+ antiporter, TMEM165/GDT1 family
MTATGPVAVLIATFLAAGVEAIEMVTIVVGVGATRGWRSTWIGSAAGFGVLAVVVAVGGVALRAIPIGPLRLVVGALLLTFGLQWFRKGVMRVAARGFAGIGGSIHEDEGVEWAGPGIDWTAFVLAFKGVTLEGLEIAILVVAFGAGADQLGPAIIGAAAALVLFGAAGLLLRGSVQRVPRSVLQLIVGVMLTTFGTFWSLEGIGVEWPGSDAAILGLLVFYGLTAAVYLTLERRRAFGLRPVT